MIAMSGCAGFVAAMNVPVKNLVRDVDVFEDGKEFFGWQVSREAVADALAQGKASIAGEDHAAKVAYLVKNGWHDPICINLGCDDVEPPKWPVFNGNHRVAAALFMGKSTVFALVKGSGERMDTLLGLG